MLPERDREGVAVGAEHLVPAGLLGSKPMGPWVKDKKGYEHRHFVWSPIGDLSVIKNPKTQTPLNQAWLQSLVGRKAWTKIPIKSNPPKCRIIVPNISK